MASTSLTCVKYLLFIFNLIFALTGIIILTVGAIIQHGVNKGATGPFVHGQLVSVPVALIAVGIIVFVVAFFGCCGAIQDNHCMILTFSVFLGAIFILELAVGITGYVLRDDVESMLKHSLNETFSEARFDPLLAQAWDKLQTDEKCCGINSFTDWEQALPRSCCPLVVETDKCDQESVYKVGCLPAVTRLLRHSAIILGGVGIGVSVIQLIGVVFACCLAKSIREDEYISYEHHDAY